MTLTSKNVYIDKLVDIVHERDNTYHNTIKMKLIDVKSSTYIDFGKENNDKDPKFKVSDHVRISKCKNIFAKSMAPNWSEEAFVIKLVKDNVLWIYIIEDLNGEEVVGKFCEKEFQKSRYLKSRYLTKSHYLT